MSGVLIDDDNHPVALISKGFQKFQKGKVPTFMDSGASDTMFISRDSFKDYKSVTPRSGDSAKAVDGNFEIIGKGTVTQHYQGVRYYLYLCPPHTNTQCEPDFCKCL